MLEGGFSRFTQMGEEERRRQMAQATQRALQGPQFGLLPNEASAPGPISPPTPQRMAPVPGIPSGPGYDGSGIAGGIDKRYGPAPQAASPAKAQYANRLESWNRQKLANSQHLTPKYQAGRIFQNFDPTQGIQQAMLDQLNQLGIGQFSGKIGGDKLSIANATGDGWDGFTGGTIDVIRDLGRGGWHWGRNLDAAGQGAQAVAGALGGGGNPAFARGFAGNAPYAASSWLSQLLKSLGVSI